MIASQPSYAAQLAASAGYDTQSLEITAGSVRIRATFPMPSVGDTEAASARLRSLVQGWHATNAELLASSASALPEAHLKEKLGRMASA